MLHNNFTNQRIITGTTLEPRGAWPNSLKDAPDLEIETRMAIVTDRAGDQNRTEYRVHEKPSCNIPWEFWRAWGVWKLVCFPQLKYPEKVNRTSQKRWQFRQLPNVAHLSQKILVCEPFICAPRNQLPRTPEGERRYSGFETVTAAAKRGHING